MERLRFNRLGIEIEINTGEPNLFEINNLFEIKETKTCVKVSCEGKKVATILPDSKIEIGGLVHITCYKGRVVVFGDAYIEAGGMSKIFAKDKAQVVAYQGAEVRAGGRAKVRALDGARIVAGGRAEVFLDGKSIGYRKAGGRVKMNKLSSRAAIFDI